MHNTITTLIKNLQKLPGVGSKSAHRLALQMIQNKQMIMVPIAESIMDAARKIKKCEICNNLDDTTPCKICNDTDRDRTTVCVVENIVDLWAFEKSKSYKGTYHVLGGSLSATDGTLPQDLSIDLLIDRINQNNIQELILATNATMSGQATAHYILGLIKHNSSMKITRLAFGMPIGGELDYLDSNTINIALSKRYTMQNT